MKNSDDDPLTSNEDKSDLPQALLDIMSKENDFIPIRSGDEESIPHTLVRWYGLRNFVVLTPLRDSLNSESKLKVLLSSFSMALNNIGW